MEKNKKIFVSYSWKNTAIADRLETDLLSLNLQLVRDVRDIEYKGSISAFMEQIRDCDFAILIISDDYLRSKNCMKEVMHVLKDRDHDNKILPIIVEGTKIYSSRDRLVYTQHWITQQKELKTQIEDLPQTAIVKEIEELKVLESIVSSINEFLTYISDKNNVTFERLRKDNYKQILDCIGLINVTHLVKLLEISLLKDIDEQELEIDDWFEEYAPTAEAYSLRGKIADDKGNIKKARANYDRALSINSEHAYVLNNYGFLLQKNRIDPELSKSMFEKAIKVMPNLTEARLNLGVLLTSDFDDPKGAQKQYEEIVAYNPTEPRAYNNLASCYRKLGGDNKETDLKICEVYKKALSLDPDYTEAHIGLGSLLAASFKDTENALYHYNEALRTNPEAEELVNLLKSRLKAPASSKKVARNEPCPCGSGTKAKKCCHV